MLQPRSLIERVWDAYDCKCFPSLCVPPCFSLHPLFLIQHSQELSCSCSLPAHSLATLVQT